LVYFDRFGPRTVKALSGKVGQQKTKSVGVLSLLKQRHLLLSLAIAGIVAPLALSAPAQAASDGSASDKSGSPASGIAQDIISYFGFGPDQANNPTDPQAVIERPRVELTPREITPVLADMEARPPQLPVVTAVSAPSVETPLHRLFCVEYARMRSGLAVFGDAKTWWARAKNLYTRVSHPVEEAVMVFSGSKRLKRGHVAVVTHIVSPRATPGLHPPDAPALPYHFVAQPAPMPGQKFGNVSGVALTPQGHLLVYNRNPAMMMVEYDAQGKFIRHCRPMKESQTITEFIQ